MYIPISQGITTNVEALSIIRGDWNIFLQEPHQFYRYFQHLIPHTTDSHF